MMNQYWLSASLLSRPVTQASLRTGIKSQNDDKRRKLNNMKYYVRSPIQVSTLAKALNFREKHKQVANYHTK